ncbi:type II toxin-antitoxin system YafO family toxin [Halomonas salipaludis]|uniref:mRNA interferase YafO n=1 Tax=Halomonas salipaludis TaxID=2032625 RepID=A0A2A2F2V6_9GAMM|nr:type II toxin-antitoxin system YafO family toxin [Halomonas salipaludis]PAU78932.1 hypothetical protein CK498_00680 [Halomonas salipaludis]
MAKVFTTTQLRDALGEDSFRQLRDEFLDWLQVGEYEHITFGKDSAFRTPRLAVDEELRHVHLIPIFDEAARDQWLLRYQRRSRKTSSRILVYTRGYYDPEKYLLIDILDEPDGHDLMCQDPQLINALAELAERFRQQY